MGFFYWNSSQCLQAVLLSFSINISIFQYFACIFSILQRAPIYHVCTKYPQFSVFLKVYWSEFSKNTDKYIYLEALSSAVECCNTMATERARLCALQSSSIRKYPVFPLLTWCTQSASRKILKPMISTVCIRADRSGVYFEPIIA